MTNEEILRMEAGEELDCLVAEGVMGEPMPEFTPENALGLQLAGSPVKSPKGNWLCLCRYDEGDIPTWRPLPYSTDIEPAWLIIDKLSEEWTKKGSPISIEVIYDCGASEVKVETWNDDRKDWNKPVFSGSCAAAPEAIVKSALIAVLHL